MIDLISLELSHSIFQALGYGGKPAVQDYHGVYILGVGQIILAENNQEVTSEI